MAYLYTQVTQAVHDNAIDRFYRDYLQLSFRCSIAYYNNSLMYVRIDTVNHTVTICPNRNFSINNSIIFGQNLANSCCEYDGTYLIVHSQGCQGDLYICPDRQ